jgi:hypothetical protein
MINRIQNVLFFVLFIATTLWFHPSSVRAALVDEMSELAAQALALDTQLKAISLGAETVCGPLVAANQLAHNLVNSIVQLDEGLAAPLQADADLLTALNQLASLTPSLASETHRLSADLQILAQTSQAITIKDGIVAILQLSNDIGTMADRIGEMADKILIMSNNIGIMADRILATQEIQNQNVQLTQQSILQTQTNMLTVLSLVESSTNDLTLNTLIIEGNLLAAKMAAVVLNPFTMKSQLASVAANIHTFLEEVTSTYGAIAQQSATSTIYVNTTTLTSLINVTIMLTSLTTAVDGYVVAIDGLKYTTSSARLSASLKSLLQLSADIGVMANRILEMGDLILAMSDNIGMEADQILVAQQLQNMNVATAQTSILAAQDLAITIIAARNL